MSDCLSTRDSIVLNDSNLVTKLTSTKITKHSAIPTRFQNHQNSKANTSTTQSISALRDRTNLMDTSLIPFKKKPISKTKKCKQHLTSNSFMESSQEMDEHSNSLIKKDAMSIQSSFDYEKCYECELQMEIDLDSFCIEGDDSKIILETKLSEALNEKQKLQDEINELRELFQIIQDDDDSIYQQRIEKCEKENAQLLEKVSSLEIENKSLNEQIANLENEHSILIEKFENEKLALNTELSKKENIIQSLNDGENLDLVLKNDSLIETIAELEKENNDKKDKLAKLKENLTIAKKQIQSYVSDQETLDAKVKKTAHEMIQLKLKHQKARNDIKAKDTLISQLQETNISYQKTMMEQKNEICELNKQIDIRGGMLKKMGEDRKIQVIITEKGRIAELEQLLQEAKEKYKDLQENSDNIKHEFEEKQNEYEQYLKEKKEYTKEMVNVTFRLGQKESELRELQETHLLVESEFNEAKKKIKSLEQLIQSKIDQIRTMQNNKDNVYSKMRENISTLTADKDSLQKSLDKSLTDIQEYTVKNEQLLLQNQTLLKKSIETSKSLENLQIEKDTLTQKLEECNSNMNNINKELALMKTSNSEKTNEIHQLQLSVNGMQEQYQELIYVYDDLKSRYNSQNIELSEIQKSYDVLKQKYNFIIAQKAEDEISIKGLSDTIEEKSKQISSLLQDLSELKAIASKESTEKSKLQQELYEQQQMHEEHFTMINGINPIEILEDMTTQPQFAEIPTQTDNITSLDIDYIQQLENSVDEKDTKLNQLHIIIYELEELVSYLERQLKEKNM